MNNLYSSKRPILRYSFAAAALMLLLATGCIKSRDLQLTPFIEHVSPDSLGKGSILVLRGKNFSFANATTTVALVFENETDTITVDGETMRSYVKPEELRIPLPEMPLGFYNVYLNVNDRSGQRKSNSVRIKVIGVFISSIEPLNAVAGQTITIKGSGLKTASKIVFATSDYVGVEVEPAEPPTNDEVKVIIPEEAVPGNVYIRTTDNTFLYGPQYHVRLPQPVITGFSATDLSLGDKLVISGTHFGPGRTYSYQDFVYSRKVYFTGADGNRIEGNISSLVEENTETTITVFVPNGAQSGPVEVEIDTVPATGSTNLTIHSITIDHGFVAIGNSGIVISGITNGQPGPVLTLHPASYVQAMTADAVSKKIFYCEDGMIKSINFDGRNVQNLIAAFANNIRVIQQDLYWTENHTAYKAGLDGSNATVISENTGSGNTIFTEISSDGSKVFVLNYDFNTGTYDILERDIATQAVTTLYAGLSFNNASPTQIRYHDGYLYINGLFEAFRLPADGNGSQEMIAAALMYASAVVPDAYQQKLLILDNQQGLISELDGTARRVWFEANTHPALNGLYHIQPF